MANSNHAETAHTGVVSVEVRNPYKADKGGRPLDTQDIRDRAWRACPVGSAVCRPEISVVLGNDSDTSSVSVGACANKACGLTADRLENSMNRLSATAK